MQSLSCGYPAAVLCCIFLVHCAVLYLSVALCFAAHAVLCTGNILCTLLCRLYGSEPNLCACLCMLYLVCAGWLECPAHSLFSATRAYRQAPAGPACIRGYPPRCKMLMLPLCICHGALASRMHFSPIKAIKAIKPPVSTSGSRSCCRRTQNTCQRVYCPILLLPHSEHLSMCLLPDPPFG